MAAPRARSRYRPRRLALRDGREVTVREIEESDASEIVDAFERLSDQSRYSRFLQYKKHLDPAAVERGVHPRPGIDFVLVATVPAAHGIDIVGAAQYLRSNAGDANTCEFAVTVAEEWRRQGLATALISRLVRRARRDGYDAIVGDVLASNLPMLALARDLHFDIERISGEADVLRVRKALHRRGPTRSGTCIALPSWNDSGAIMKATKSGGEQRNRPGRPATGDRKDRVDNERDASQEGREERLAEERRDEESEPTVAPVSGVAMSGTGAPVRSRSHSGTTTMPGAGPSPNPIVTPETKKP
ncbi:MAG: GNAT family N-acetyltransferase [Burkholderiaceae bacterium]|jgi:GNAT superfamily N-acetyltransferase|nr:GNAT family N-acetyltransferase [Burkholderiaceae bacterium]